MERVPGKGDGAGSSSADWPSRRPLITRRPPLPLSLQAFGSVAFLFFVHFTMPPIEASMAKPDRFLAAATKGFTFSVIVSTLFGAVGALYFGPSVNSVVIAMLQGQGIVVAVKLLLCLNLLCTFPVVVGGAFQILEVSCPCRGEMDGGLEGVYADSLPCRRSLYSGTPPARRYLTPRFTASGQFLWSLLRPLRSASLRLGSSLASLAGSAAPC